MSNPEQTPPTPQCAMLEAMEQIVQYAQTDPSKLAEQYACQSPVGSFVCSAVVYLRPSKLAELEEVTYKVVPAPRPDCGPCLNRLPPKTYEYIDEEILRDFLDSTKDEEDEL